MIATLDIAHCPTYAFGTYGAAITQLNRCAQENVVGLR
jgi:hypothetical protein